MIGILNMHIAISSNYCLALLCGSNPNRLCGRSLLIFEHERPVLFIIPILKHDLRAIYSII
ncbi:hypothetical protein D3C73_725490 [compost metagenome]